MLALFGRLADACRHFSPTFSLLSLISIVVVSPNQSERYDEAIPSALNDPTSTVSIRRKFHFLYNCFGCSIYIRQKKETMNLCGDIVNVTEHEMVMELPEDHFAMKYRRKSSSSTPSNRRRKGSRSSSRSKSRQGKSSSLAAGESDSVDPGFLNPISREDLKKSRSRHGRKTPTGGGLKKLEDGFDLVSYARGRMQ